MEQVAAVHVQLVSSTSCKNCPGWRYANWRRALAPSKEKGEELAFGDWAPISPLWFSSSSTTEHRLLVCNVQVDPLAGWVLADAGDGHYQRRASSAIAARSTFTTEFRSGSRSPWVFRLRGTTLFHLASPLHLLRRVRGRRDRGNSGRAVVPRRASPTVGRLSVSRRASAQLTRLWARSTNWANPRGPPTGLG